VVGLTVTVFFVYILILFLRVIFVRYSLEGTHISGGHGLTLMRALQNVYEVQLPLLLKCVHSASTAFSESMPAPVQNAMLVHLQAMQRCALELLHTLLTATVSAMHAKIGAAATGDRSSTAQRDLYSDHFDSMDVLREDGVTWLSFFQGQDPLGRDVLVLSAASDNHHQPLAAGSASPLSPSPMLMASTSAATAGAGRLHSGGASSSSGGNSSNSGRGGGGAAGGHGFSSGVASVGAVASVNLGKAVAASGVQRVVDEEEVLRGCFVSDYLLLYGAELVQAAVALSADELAGSGGGGGGGGGGSNSIGSSADRRTHEDAEKVRALVESLRVDESLLQMKAPARAAAIEVAPPMSSPVVTSSSAASSQSNNSSAEAIKNIKSIFPDLGEGFIEICIEAYKGNIEELIEALLMDNLQPKLLLLDRTLQKMWLGRGGAAADSTVSLRPQDRDAAAVYKSVEDKDFRSLQKQRVQQMEQQREMDHMLLTREYQDDYDDQVRRSWSWSASSF
jgi:hypothetical protein